MGNDGPLFAVGGSLLTAAVSHVLTLTRDRRRDRRAALMSEHRELHQRLDRLENTIIDLRTNVAGTDVLLKAVLRHQLPVGGGGEGED